MSVKELIIWLLENFGETHYTPVKFDDGINTPIDLERFHLISDKGFCVIDIRDIVKQANKVLKEK